MSDENYTGNSEKLPFQNLPPAITIITLADLLTRLGEEWRPALLAAVGKDLKWVSHVCNGKNNPENLDWDKTKIETDVAKAWFLNQPVFAGPFKGAPPRLTRACVLQRIGDIWATLLKESRLPKDRSPIRPSEDEFKTTDVAAWYSIKQPATPAIPESIPPETSLLPEPTASTTTPVREIALVEAENAALSALRKSLRREPDFDEFWDYLTTFKDETGTVADCTDNRLDWIGKSGQAHSTKKSTFRNRLTAAKKRNPFTPA